MIKNWEMFLESSYNGDSGDGEKLRKEVLEALGPFIDNMSEKRPTMSVEEITQVADAVVKMFTDMFGKIIQTKDWPEIIKEKACEFFVSSLNSSRETMINDSFRNGFLHLIDEFLELMNGLQGNEEGEEWKQPKEKGYEDLSNKEIQDLIDIALDNRDFDEVRKLSQYLESYSNFNLESDIEKAINSIIRYIELIIA